RGFADRIGRGNRLLAVYRLQISRRAKERSRGRTGAGSIAGHLRTCGRLFRPGGGGGPERTAVLPPLVLERDGRRGGDRGCLRRGLRPDVFARAAGIAGASD